MAIMSGDGCKALGGVVAVILAGGFGTRLRSVVADRPKVLAEVRGKPFLMYLLDRLSEFGIGNVILCTGYRAEQVSLAIGETYNKMKILYSQETSPLGTGGALKLASKQIHSPLVLVLNGDSFLDVNLKDFVLWHQRRKSSVSLALAKVSNTQRYGQVQLNESGQVINFKEKEAVGGEGLINAGIYLFDGKILTDIPETVPLSLEKDVFPNWTNGILFGYPCSGKFIDIGTPESYAEAEHFFDNFSG